MRDSVGDVVAEVAHAGLVERGDAGDDLDVERRSGLDLPAATAPDERLDVVDRVHRRPPVDGDAAVDEAPADVGVQRGLLDPEQAGGLAGSHEAAHGVDGSARVNVDLINVDHAAVRASTIDVMTTLIDVPPGLNGVAVTDTSIGDVDGEAGFFHYRGLDATELARDRRFEEAWHLIARGHLPDAAELAAFRAEVAAARPLPTSLHPGARAARHGDRADAGSSTGGGVDRRRRARAAPADRPRPRPSAPPRACASPP